MKMEQETKKFTTTSGKEVEIKTYFTRQEKNSLKKIFLKGLSIDPETEKTSGLIPAENMVDAQEAIVKIITVSFDGSTENVFDRVMQSKDCDDFDEILQEADKIDKGNLTEAK